MSILVKLKYGKTWTAVLGSVTIISKVLPVGSIYSFDTIQACLNENLIQASLVGKVSDHCAFFII